MHTSVEGIDDSLSPESASGPTDDIAHANAAGDHDDGPNETLSVKPKPAPGTPATKACRR
jgi:hypothetical protein